MQNFTGHGLYSLSLTRPITFAMVVLMNGLILPAQAAGDFMLLGDLSNNSNFSSASSVNADGSVVVGGNSSASGAEAYRWTQAGGMVGLGYLFGGLLSSSASDVSADGSVVVGVAQNSALRSEAFRWTQIGGMVGLGDLAGGDFSSFATAVNADGSVVVGNSDSGGGNYEAFRWTQADGMVGLGDMRGGTFAFHNYSLARDVSADGNVVVGSAWNSALRFEAFRWTPTGGMVGLGVLSGGITLDSAAHAVSADGNVVVGYSLSANGQEAFRWTQTDGMVGLGDLAGGNFSSIAFAVNADGSVVVGYSTSANGYFEAFRWTQTDGMVSVRDWLASTGVIVPSDYLLSTATGVSADGNVIVGTVSGPNFVEAYLARAGSGVINPVANTQSVMETGARALQVAMTLPNMVLFGAHHRTILDDGLVKTANSQGCAWAAGDFGRNNESQAKMGTAEMGICKDIGSARIGVGFGLDWAKQNLNLDGKASYSGQHVLVEAANAFENGLQPSVLAYYGRYDAEVTRQYQNAGNIDSSFGTTKASSKAIRLRLDWKDLVRFGNSSITPYAAYTWMRTSIDGYTERSGGFPVQFDNNRWTTNDVRLGAATYFAVNTDTNLRIGAEAVHRFEDNTASGRVLGLNNFSCAGKDIKQNWVHTNVDVDHRFTDDMLLTVGLNVGTGGSDNNWGLTAGLRANY